MLVLKEIAQTWVAKIVLQRPDLNAFFPLRGHSEPTQGLDFNREKEMLPAEWKELYRLFDSFGLTRESNVRDWINTPFSHANRLDVEEYDRIAGGIGGHRALAERIGSEKLRCWLATESGDALWLDEARCDGIVYHIRGVDYEDVFTLPDPRRLDLYLRHIAIGRPPSAFDFRR